MSEDHRAIFISYSHASGLELARTLEARLGPDRVFRDAPALQVGEKITERIFDALVGAQVFVALFDEHYLARPFCLAEYRLALQPIDLLGPSPQTIDRIVLVLPDEPDPALLDRISGPLRDTQWPHASDVDGIVRLIESRLGPPSPPTITELLSEETMVQVEDEWITIGVDVPPPSPLPPGYPAYHLPRESPSLFVGRAELLRELHGRLTLGPGPPVVALVGFGGTGKTRVANEYILRYGTRAFAGGTFRIDATAESGRSGEWYGALKKMSMGPIPSLPELTGDADSAEQSLAAALRATTRTGPVLWVLDNLPETPAGTAPIDWQRWSPWEGEDVAILITSRMNCHPPEMNLPVGPLGRRASRALLRHGMNHEVFPAGIAHRLAALVGDHPLALEHLHMILRYGAHVPVELLAKLEREGPIEPIADVIRTLRPYYPEEVLRPIAEVFRASFLLLDEPSQKLARTLAWWGTTRIPLQLMQALGDEDAPSGAKHTLRVRNCVGDAPGYSYGAVHPILRDYFRAEDSDRSGCARATRTLLQSAQSLDPSNPAQWDYFADLISHLGAIAASPEVPVTDRIAARRAAAGFLTDQGDIRAASDLIDENLELAALTLGPKDLGTLGCRLDRLRLLERDGEPGAIIHVASELLTQLTKAVGPDHPHSLSAETLIAVALDQLGQRREAIARLEDLLPRRIAVSGLEDADTQRLMNTLALVLSRDGQYRKAVVRARQLFELRQRLYGLDHAETLHGGQSYLYTLTLVGDYSTAAGLGPELYATCLRALRADHPTTLLTLHNLAEVEAQTGRTVAALAHYDQLVADRTRRKGPDHPYTLNSRSNRVRLLGLLGDPGTIPELEALAAALDERPGAAHFAPKTSYFVAQVRAWQGDHPGARDVLTDVIPRGTESLGETHPLILRMQSLAGSLDDEDPTAIALLRATLETQRATLGLDHPDGAVTASLLGERLLAAEAPELHAEGVALLRGALALFEKQVPYTHLERTLTAYALWQAARSAGESGAEFMPHLRWLRDVASEDLPLPLRGVREAVAKD